MSGQATVRGAVLGLVVGLAAPGAGADTLRVPGDRPTIQGAIDAARDGDVVVVADGLFHERIRFDGRAITVRSQNGAAHTTITADSGGSVVTFDGGEGPRSVLDGFTLTGGRNDAGGGVRCTEGAAPRIRNCVIADNVATTNDGGGVYCAGSAPTLESCTIARNSAGEHGGGVSAKYDAVVTLTNCLIDDNDAGAIGGGIHVYGAKAYVGNCTIADNTAHAGGGLGGESGRIYVANSILWGDRDFVGANEVGGGDADVRIARSDVEGGFGGKGNLAEDPSFADGHRLMPGSPCIDAGARRYASFRAPKTDLEGDLRPQGRGVDIGCDEYSVVERPTLLTCDFIGVPTVVFETGDSIRYALQFTVPGEAGVEYRVTAAGRARGSRYAKSLRRSAKLVPGTYTWTWDASIPRTARPGPVDVAVKITIRRLGTAARTCEFEIE